MDNYNECSAQSTDRNPKRFYHTVSAVNAPIIIKTMEQAIKEAVKRVDNGYADEVYIVEIVKVVRRVTPPVAIYDYSGF